MKIHSFTVLLERERIWIRRGDREALPAAKVRG